MLVIRCPVCSFVGIEPEFKISVSYVCFCPACHNEFHIEEADPEELGYGCGDSE